jgi:hypothetical protein
MKHSEIKILILLFVLVIFSSCSPKIISNYAVSKPKALNDTVFELVILRGVGGSSMEHNRLSSYFLEEALRDSFHIINQDSANEILSELGVYSYDNYSKNLLNKLSTKIETHKYIIAPTILRSSEGVSGSRASTQDAHISISYEIYKIDPLVLVGSIQCQSSGDNVSSVTNILNGKNDENIYLATKISDSIKHIAYTIKDEILSFFNRKSKEVENTVDIKKQNNIYDKWP